MSTSGITTFVVKRDDLIKDALLMAEAIGIQQTPSGSIIAHAARQLNLILKSMQAIGMELWSIKTGYVFLAKGTNEYALGPTGNHTTDTYTTTTTTATLASASTTVDLATVSGITVGDNIGIIDDTGALVWKTVGSISVLTVTFGSLATYGSTAAMGAKVFVYTNKIQRPLQIPNAVIKTYNGDEVPIFQISREEWNRFGSKASTGQASQYYFDPQLINAKISLFPAPSDVSSVVLIRYQRPFDDVLASNDDFDFPQEWLLFIQITLALVLAPVYSVPREKVKSLKELWNMENEKLQGFDREHNTSVFITVRKE